MSLKSLALLSKFNVKTFADKMILVLFFIGWHWGGEPTRSYVRNFCLSNNDFKIEACYSHQSLSNTSLVVRSNYMLDKCITDVDDNLLKVQCKQIKAQQKNTMLPYFQIVYRATIYLDIFVYPRVWWTKTFCKWDKTCLWNIYYSKHLRWY